MTFEEWWEELNKFHPEDKKYERSFYAGAAWNCQQEKIDELEIKLKHHEEVLRYLSNTFAYTEDGLHMKLIAEKALKAINKLEKK